MQPSNRRHVSSAAKPSLVLGVLPAAVLVAVTLPVLVAQAQEAPQQKSVTTLPTITVAGPGSGAYAGRADTHTKTADLGPLGKQKIKDLPYSVTVVPQDVLVNQQIKKVNTALGFLPSVEIRDQQGFDISRPQARGFQGSIVQNTRLDGLNVVGTTAIPVENLESIQVLNGPAGALYGPETPAGVFDYRLKRPTDAPLFRYIESFDSRGVFTEWIDAGGPVDKDGKLAYRLNLVHGQGESYVKGSYDNRSLGSIALDYHLDNQTVIETNYSHYATDETGLPGSIVFNSGASTTIPLAPDPTRPGYGQPGAGVNLRSDTGVVKLKHDFNSDWHLEIGGLYENAVRNLYGITNMLTDDAGAFTTVKNFNAVPRFTVASDAAYLNGRVDLLGTKNDVTLGTNGYDLGMYNYVNSIAQTLGTASIANPIVFPQAGAVPPTGGQYFSGYLRNQSLITGDTMHFNDIVAVQGVLSTSFLSSKSYAADGSVTSADRRDFALSPTGSFILTPTPKLTTYFTYASSIEQGDTAPTGTANQNQILAPYHDEIYEVGAKYAVSPKLLLTLAGFKMTRPFAFADATTNIFAVGGTQRNYGIEFFAQGAVSHDLSVLGGATYIDARLLNSGNPLTDDRLIVGVPHYKVDTLFDYHPDLFRGGALTAAVHYEDARAATNTNNSFAPQFATLDLGARYSTTLGSHHATLRFQVTNITDTRYYISIADGNIVGSAGANTAYLGTPRVYATSLELDF